MTGAQLIGFHSIALEFSATRVGTLAQVAVERIFNSLPEGLLLALFAWAVLRVLPKQNSGTRFAVWLLALLAVVGMPFVGGFGGHRIFTDSQNLTGSASAISLPTHWAPYILLIWILASSIGLARLVIGLVSLSELKRSCVPVNSIELDPSIRQTVEELNGATSFASRTVTVATSQRVRVPAALGLWKPMIVFPEWALRELPPSDLSIILRHEFAHLQRWDDWTNLAQKFVRALLFFHPAVWWIDNRLSVEREMACDDVVVAQTDNPTGYASCLVTLLERSLAQRGWTMAQAIVHRAREASMRVAQILDKNRPTATQLSKPALALVGVFTMLCLAVAPEAPQFVAFDRNPLPSANHEQAATLAQPMIVPASMVHSAMLSAANAQGSLQPAAAIPAALKTKGASLPQSSPAKKSTFAPAHPVVGRDAAPWEEVQADMNLAPTPESLIEASMIADRNMQAMFQTLTFAQRGQAMSRQDAESDSTIYISTISGTPTSGATVWRIQVWRVTVVNPVWERPARAPLAHKI